MIPLFGQDGILFLLSQKAAFWIFFSSFSSLVFFWSCLRLKRFSLSARFLNWYISSTTFQLIIAMVRLRSLHLLQALRSLVNLTPCAQLQPLRTFLIFAYTQLNSRISWSTAWDLFSAPG